VYGFVSSGTSNRKCEFSCIPEWWHCFRIFLWFGFHIKSLSVYTNAIV
jgi:hypothetical protein